MESRTSPGKKGSVQPISGYPSGRFSSLPGFGIQTRRTGLGFAPFPVFRVDLFAMASRLCWSDGFDSIYACRFLALVILCHPSHCQKPGCLGFRQEFL